MKTEILEQPITKIPQYRKRYNIILNDVQQWQYDLLIKGLNIFPESELKRMHPDEKREIIYRNDYCWRIINKLKQEKMNKFLANILNKVFAGQLCGNAVGLLLDPITDNQFQVNPNISEYHVSQEQIIHALINNRLLSNNFLK